MERDTVKRIHELERWQEGLALPEIGPQPVWLAEPYTNTTFDGDSFSDVGAHTKIENTSWSTAVPANAKAIAIEATVRDSGSAADPAVWFGLYSTATATNPALTAYCSGLANDAFTAAAGIVPCTNGDVWYKCGASGATTLDVWLRVVGYWL